jgi:hypothetical protein
MTQSSLQSLIGDLEKKKTKLTIEGQSFGSESLFSAIQGLMNLRAPCSSPDFQKIRDISTKLTNVNNLIEFCETILRKIKSTEEPFNPNEKTFLDYIYMVSQILGMTLEIVKIQESTNSIFSYYKRTFNCLSMRISERFKAFMNFMTYSYYWQRIVQDKKRTWQTINSGSPSIRVS